MIEGFAAAVIAAVVVGAAATGLVVRYAARIGLMDVPNDRSSHLVATPRGGGIGIVAGVAAGIVVFTAAGMPPDRGLGALLLAAAAIAALGAFDDARPIPARYRLLVQALIAIALLMAVGVVGRLPLPGPLDISLGWLAWPLNVVWLVGATNFYNFMDGIDGLAGGQAIASCIGIMVAAWSFGAVQLAAIVGAATVGFLFFNRPPARVFLGDVGSTTLGFCIAAMPLLAPAAGRPMAMLAVAIGLSLFLLDPAETLVRLLRYGHKLGVAHRAHSYQRLASSSRHRTLVATSILLCGIGLSVGGGLSYRMPSLAWPLVVVGLGLFSIERFLAGRYRTVPDRLAPDQL